MENINENDEKIRKQREQVDLNFKAFSEKLPKLIALQMNKYALMRNGEIVEVYNSWEDAYKTGLRFFEDELFCCRFRFLFACRAYQVVTIQMSVL